MLAVLNDSVTFLVFIVMLQKIATYRRFSVLSGNFSLSKSAQLDYVKGQNIQTALSTYIAARYNQQKPHFTKILICTHMKKAAPTHRTLCRALWI